MKNHQQKNALQVAPTAQEYRVKSLPTVSTTSDSELVTEIAAHSQVALATLLARHSPLLRTVIYRVMNDAGEIEEVLQDVFLHIWNHAETYSEKKGQLLGWLVTIARRRAVDRVRRRAAYQRATTRFEESSRHFVQIQGSSWVVDKEVQQNELQVVLDNHLRLLPALQSEVLKLAYLNGLSQREIAVRLSVPLGTVKTRVELGVRKLSRSSLLQQVA